ncbi:type II toxin-antitoxin system RelE/ParE family toxin [Algiphilus aromaticivorans]|uniref:type II toxin-antitoxin system RelE/ParE family toxin n=1 Tax=Algiphilus aromaticivorans TaxID=382454 RepID=UPI0005C14E2F|nr:type II toxin-antitoxin system mRNA interferase toxin, RelE/StbE family [Algiphilus aromaticivorans]
MKLVWTREAAADRSQIRAYIAQDNPSAALSLDEQISAKASSLADHPDLGRPGRVAGTRELVVHENYIAVYDVTSGQVRILRVLHAARRWPAARQRS